MTTPRSGAVGWLVLLLGGASGVGKTRVGYRLARHCGVPLVEVDDFQAVLERMTTPGEQPELHFFRTRLHSLSEAGGTESFSSPCRGIRTFLPATGRCKRAPRVCAGGLPE